MAMLMYSVEYFIPDGITAEIAGRKVKITGSKGTVEKEFVYTSDVKIESKDGKIVVSSEKENRKTKALGGTIISHVKNMVEGVTKGFTYKLHVVYSHFPVTVKVEGEKVIVQNFLGARTPRIADIVGDTQVKIDKAEIIVTGITLEDVSQTAANIEQSCRIVGFDKKRFQDGVYIVEKAGSK
jgi:large subunit ribosomal protein L6